MNLNAAGLKLIESSKVYRKTSVEEAENAILNLVRLPLNENQFSALVSFVVTISPKTFKRSKMLRLLNDGQFHRDLIMEAANEFLMWTHKNNKECSYLKSRRKKERALFLKLTLVASNGL